MAPAPLEGKRPRSNGWLRSHSGMPGRPEGFRRWRLIFDAPEAEEATPLAQIRRIRQAIGAPAAGQ